MEYFGNAVFSRVVSFRECSSSKRRWKRRLKKIKRQYREDEISFEEITRSVASYKGHLKHGHTYKLQKKVFHDFVLTKEKRMLEQREEGKENHL